MQIPGLKDVQSVDLISSISKLELDLSRWNENDRIGGLLTRTVLSGGKRLRPLLNFLMADLFGLEHNNILPFARVVELVHAATLAHDDVIDNADMRRGQPSINATATNKKAVLAGDFLLAYAVDEVARIGNSRTVRSLTKIIRELAEGEWLQLENAAADQITRDAIDRVALLKTGSVLRWCCEIPAIVANLPEEKVSAACLFGEKLGVAFQMSDDVIDFKRRDGSEFADLKSGVISSVLLEAAVLHYGSETVERKWFHENHIDQLPIHEGIKVVSERCKNQLSDCRKILREIVHQGSTAGNVSVKEKTAMAALEGLIDYISNRACP